MTVDCTEEMLGYRVMTGTVAACAEQAMRWVAEGDSCRWLACLNPHSYAVGLREKAFAEALCDADWLLPDGSGIVLASRWLGGCIRGRVTGWDIFQELLDRLNREGGHRVFFLGSTSETLDMIRARMAVDYPCVALAGFYSPPFKPAFSAEDDDRMVSAVNEASPDVLWVGMTAPKQELWIARNRHRLQVKIAAAVGAVFDFYSGQVKRPHPFFRRHGLEWLPRLVGEPRRLWRRTAVSAPIFLWHVGRTKIRRLRGRDSGGKGPERA